MIRLDKFLADCGKGTRREVRNYIKAGRVRVDGNPIKDIGFKFDENVAEVTFDGVLLSFDRFRYYMLNKPAGVVSATKDNLSDTVLDILKDEVTKNCFPVGRLDKDTEGLLLITNDGTLSHELLSPKKHVEKEYIAVSDVTLSADGLRQFAAGLDIGDDTVTLPAVIEPFDCDNANGYKVIIHEGRYHQVKRMFEAVGGHIIALKRVRMGELRLDDTLAPGEYRKLTPDEIALLKGER